MLTYEVSMLTYEGSGTVTWMGIPLLVAGMLQCLFFIIIFCVAETWCWPLVNIFLSRDGTWLVRNNCMVGCITRNTESLINGHIGLTIIIIHSLVIDLLHPFHHTGWTCSEVNALVILVSVCWSRSEEGGCEPTQVCSSQNSVAVLGYTMLHKLFIFLFIYL